MERRSFKELDELYEVSDDKHNEDFMRIFREVLTEKANRNPENYREYLLGCCQNAGYDSRQTDLAMGFVDLLQKMYTISLEHKKEEMLKEKTRLVNEEVLEKLEKMRKTKISVPLPDCFSQSPTCHEREELDEDRCVNNPDHYVGMNGMEAIDVVAEFNFDNNYNLATALTYLLRCEKKGQKKTDLGKCIWYLRREYEKTSIEE